MNKIKEVFKELKEKVTKASKKKLIIASVSSVIVLALIIFICISNFKLTKLERITIEEYNQKIGDNLDLLLDEKEDGRYVIFALDYLYNNSQKEEYFGEDIIEVINNNFDENYDSKKLEKIGVTPLMQSKGIMYDAANNIYTYKNEQTRADIANTPITKYDIKSIKKYGKKKFVVTYETYVIDNPYEILNYYNELNSKSEEKVDTKDILDYLKGTGNVKKVRALITKDNIKKIGKKGENVKVTYVIKGNKLVLK